jgi:hypothetical protein
MKAINYDVQSYVFIVMACSCVTSDYQVVFLRNMLRLLVAASVVPSPPFLVNMMMEALGSSETSTITRATRRNSQKTQFFLVTALRTSNLPREVRFNFAASILNNLF